jgi:L-ascorbate metabolism protein UlaG (beta-lactamase superfamily)
MIISWHGEGCFKIQNGDTVVLVDPIQKESGLSVPRFKTDLIIRTITPWPKKEEDDDTTTIWGAGEYDRSGIKVRGSQLAQESQKSFFKTVYSLLWDEVSIGLFGALEQPLSPEAMTRMEEVDVLIGPGGGDPFIDQKEMNKLIKKLNPKIFIPSFFKVPGLKRKAQDIKIMEEGFDGDIEKNQEKLVFKKKDLADIKKTKMVYLKV